MWCHPCSVMANYRCQLHCESGTGLPLLGVLSSHRISRFFALSEVGKVKRELPTLGGSTPDFMIARSFSHLADVSDSTFQPATDRYGKARHPNEAFCYQDFHGSGKPLDSATQYGSRSRGPCHALYNVCNQTLNSKMPSIFTGRIAYIDRLTYKKAVIC